MFLQYYFTIQNFLFAYASLMLILAPRTHPPATQDRLGNGRRSCPYLCSNDIQRPWCPDSICNCVFCSITICLLCTSLKCVIKSSKLYMCVYIFFLILAEFFTLALDNVSSLLSFKRKSLRLEESFSQMVPYPKR